MATKRTAKKAEAKKPEAAKKTSTQNATQKKSANELINEVVQTHRSQKGNDSSKPIQAAKAACANSMIMQVDEATRGIMEEIKSELLDGLSFDAQNEELKSIAKSVSELSASIDTCSSVAGEAKQAVANAENAIEDINARVAKLTKDIKKVSDEQQKMNEKLDQILALLKGE